MTVLKAVWEIAKLWVMFGVVVNCWVTYYDMELVTGQEKTQDIILWPMLIVYAIQKGLAK